MFKQKSLSWLCVAAFGFVAAGCGDAENNIVERDPIVTEEDDHNHGHEHEGEGRLVILNNTTPEAAVFNLEDNSLADSFALNEAPSAIYATGGYRYAALIYRTDDLVEFIDGGIWQEDHVDHLHAYEEAPMMLTYSLEGSRPTHFVNHDGQLAIFYDGDGASMEPALVTVITDQDIASENTELPTLLYPINMHGAAQPRGDYLLATVRRDDAETTSANPVLPDQVGVYHLHDGEYEQEEIIAETCPDLHGSAQNEAYVIFGCSDGVLILHNHVDGFESAKVANPADMEDGLRIGSIYGHEGAQQFIGMASAHGGASVQFFSIDPEAGEMELIDWDPVADARVVSRGFTFEAEQFVILDDQGYLTLLEPHAHDGHVHWEFADRIDITEEDVATMPADSNFSLTVAQNGHIAYVADPIAQHVVVIDLETMAIVDEIELGFVPSGMTWVGIVEAHDH